MQMDIGIRRLLASLALAFGLGAGRASPAAESGPGIAPPEGTVFGMTYGQWLAAWWQHVFQIPKASNPIHDPTGQHCAQRQSGPVWFLAGDGGGRPVTRTCTVPAGKALFFPIINVECSNRELPPFYGKSEADLRACVGPIVDGIAVDSLKVVVDGMEVPLLRRYRMQSVKFDFSLPEDNILGALPGRGSAVADGYWLMLEPLKPGWHTIHFEGRFASGVGKGHSQDVTYKLIVAE